MSKIVSLLIVLIGLGGGVGAGFLLRPSPEAVPVAGQPAQAHGTDARAAVGTAAARATESVRLREQFVIPVIRGGAVRALMVISLGLEVTPGTASRINDIEPRLRDVFLQVMFDHANSGGFDGVFTSSESMTGLRTGLREAAQSVLGEVMHEVLITEMFRRDV